jgi:putative permease
LKYLPKVGKKKEVFVIHIVRTWFNRYFSDPEAVLLFFVLMFGFGLVVLMSEILAPVLASIVIAYLLDWIVIHLQQLRVPRLVAVILVFMGFLGLLLMSFLILLPLLWKEVIALFSNLPNMLIRGQQLILELVTRFPQFVIQEQVNTFSSQLLTEARNSAKTVLSVSLSSITATITAVVYLVLVPLLVFFFLKDRDKLVQWVVGFLPHKRGVLSQVSAEVNSQIGNYIRGKVVEILVVALATYCVFWYFGLQYAVLLAALVGISVLIPYVGAIVITIPVLLVSYFQWGWGSQLGYFTLVYLIVQGLDANILVPLLFAEAVNLHPVAIVVATLFFGGVWGFFLPFLWPHWLKPCSTLGQNQAEK